MNNAIYIKQVQQINQTEARIMGKNTGRTWNKMDELTNCPEAMTGIALVVFILGVVLFNIF